MKTIHFASDPDKWAEMKESGDLGWAEKQFIQSCVIVLATSRDPDEITDMMIRGTAKLVNTWNVTDKDGNPVLVSVPALTDRSFRPEDGELLAAHTMELISETRNPKRSQEEQGFLPNRSIRRSRQTRTKKSQPLAS